MTQQDFFAGESLLPRGLVHVPHFLDEAEEAGLLEVIAALELREAKHTKRRVAAFGAEYDYDEKELLPAPAIAPFLLPLRARLAALAGIAPDELGYVLVAEYRPGTQLGWHRDVPKFDVVAGVSLFGAATMRFRRYTPRPGGGPPRGEDHKGGPLRGEDHRGGPPRGEDHKRRIFTLSLAPRSAYVLRGEARWGWQHSIAPTPSLRYSITFRTRKSGS
jgi:alkylated DNA repair dioxygenase AlkB